MKRSVVATKSSKLELNNALIKEIYTHVTFLANHRYRLAIKTLKSRHKGYESEDFIQECVKLVIESFENHSFETIYHLKSFINKIMNFHYLKEKRKYFYTKQRGFFNECSIDEYFIDGTSNNCTLQNIIEGQKDINIDNLVLHNIQQVNLYVVYDWQKAIVCTFEELKNYKKGYIISVNSFIKLQIEMGLRETCRYFKNIGFYMTRNIFNEISEAILEYLNKHGFLEKVNISNTYKYNRPSIEDEINRLTKLANTCNCGYVNKNLVLSDMTWQCPNCGKIHDRDLLIKSNSAK